MDYKKCTKCGRYVPPTKYKCPHCGNIVNEKQSLNLIKRFLRKILRRSH